MDETTESGQWGIVELMGHKVVAGFMQKSEMLGKPLLRVDVPASGDYPAFTQLYGEAAIYCVTFVSEEVARRAAASYRVNPVSVYVPDLITWDKHQEQIDSLQKEMCRLRGLPAPKGAEDREQEGEEKEDGWLCQCGNYQENGLHCSSCGNQPPWGCDCSQCDEDESEEEDPPGIEFDFREDNWPAPRP